MKLSELNALSGMLGGDSEDVEVAPGVVLTMRPCGVRRYVRHVVRPHRSIREQFLAPARMIKSASRPGAGEADAMASIDWEAQAEAAMGDRVEADIALVACCMADADSEIPAFAKWVSERLPDDAFVKAKSKADAMTFGEDPSVFFGQVAGQVTGMDLMVRMTPTTPADGPST